MEIGKHFGTRIQISNGRYIFVALFFELWKKNKTEIAIISVNMDRGASALQGNLQSSEGASFVRGWSGVVVGSATEPERDRSLPKTAERAKRQRRARTERSGQNIFSIF